MNRSVLQLAYVLSLCLGTTSCSSLSFKEAPQKVTCIHIFDRNGMSETISSKERLATFEHTDFSSPQPYQKVTRVFAREKNGDICSHITTYHPNGQIKQSLEAINQRACGNYFEWHPNGQIKIEATLIGGVADIDNRAEETWLFDGMNRVWNEEGLLVAEIFYQKGVLEGDSFYYHPNQTLWKKSPFSKGVLHGTEQVFLNTGILFQTTDYTHGIKEGIALRYWDEKHLAYQEFYERGLLKEAHYFDTTGSSISEIQDGKGFRPIFGKKHVQELQEYRNGIQEGTVQVFHNGHLERLYSIKNGEKEGAEYVYYLSSNSKANQPQLLMTWHEGVLQGPIKTWYPDGVLESQKEMSQNKKNGLLMCWYANGSLLLVEEYANDILVKGEYFRSGENTPISKIENGKGIATLHHTDGNFSRKITYVDGKPVE